MIVSIRFSKRAVVSEIQSTTCSCAVRPLQACDITSPQTWGPGTGFRCSFSGHAVVVHGSGPLPRLFCLSLPPCPSANLLFILQQPVQAFADPLPMDRANRPLFCVHACSVYHSRPTLCDLMDCSLPGFSAHGIFHARILEWVAVCFSRESCQPRDRMCISCISCIGRRILCHCGPCIEPASSFKQVYWSTYHSVFSNHLFLCLFHQDEVFLQKRKKKNKTPQTYFIYYLFICQLQVLVVACWVFS